MDKTPRKRASIFTTMDADYLAEFHKQGHTPKLNEDGEPDFMAYSPDGHNGLICTICGYSACMWCNQGVIKGECMTETVKDKAGLKEINLHIRFTADGRITLDGNASLIETLGVLRLAEASLLLDTERGTVVRE